MARSEQELIRFEKLAKLRESGFIFPNDVKKGVPTSSVREAVIPEGEERGEAFCVQGRIVAKRMMGKAAFVHIQDREGKLQLYVRKDEIGDEAYEEFREFDIGDIVECAGQLFLTKTGEKSLWASSLRLLTKSLIPLPEKWHGLKDVEARYRQRYVDLIANPDVANVFRTRAQVIKEIRRFLDDRGYVEVETPVLQTVPGGADARPFVTHHNTLDVEMKLRISLELPLKKLIVGGLERVYEMSRVFRNEGISKKHNPEFTTIEFYQAYATFDDLMQLTEEMLSSLVEKVCGSTKITFDEQEIDFAAPWTRVSMQESIHTLGGIERDVDLSTVEGVQKVAAAHKIELPEPNDWGRSLNELWGELVEPNIINPTFITHHPLSISPLARKNQENPLVTDRFELVVAGMELANAFSELNDAQDQRERFEGQAMRKAAGDEEASDIEEDFITALEYGMPPTAGQGIGIDRLVMLLTNSRTIRDVILFPQMKPKEA